MKAPIIRNPLRTRLEAVRLAAAGHRERSVAAWQAAAFDRALVGIVRARLAKTTDIDGERLTNSAAAILYQLDQNALALALASFAYDVRHTVTEVLALDRSAPDRAVETEIAALRGRILNRLALNYFASGRVRGDLRDIAAPLEIGLGREALEWLFRHPVDLSDAGRWLQSHGASLDAFSRHVSSRVNGRE